MSPVSSARKPKVWIDADTGNETDDAYAILRLLIAPEIDIVGLSSAHFNNPDLLCFEKWNQYPTEGIDPVGISQELNVELLRLTGRLEIPHPLGADRQIGRAWGERTPRPCPAVTELIAAVHRLAPGERLDVIALAAVTNIASAVLIDPSILPRIRCHGLAAKYDLARGVWNKSEFNVRNDLNAFDCLLDEPGFDLFMMSTDTARPYEFPWEEVVARIDDSVPAQRFLKDRWQETNPQDATRILWDLALVEAYLRPEFATIREISTPPENTPRRVHLYDSIDVPALTKDFWDALGQMEVRKRADPGPRPPLKNPEK